jgi:outer membrane protein
LPLWEAGIGAAFFSTPAYPGADDRSNRGLVLPYLIYRGKSCAPTRTASAHAC